MKKILGGDTMIYTTRPQQVEAIRYTGDNYDEIREFTNGSVTRASIIFPSLTLIGEEWNQIVEVGEWIVKYSDYECDAFSDKEFRATFKEEQL